MCENILSQDLEILSLEIRGEPITSCYDTVTWYST